MVVKKADDLGHEATREHDGDRALGEDVQLFPPAVLVPRKHQKSRDHEVRQIFGKKNAEVVKEGAPTGEMMDKLENDLVKRRHYLRTYARRPM